MLGNGVPSFAPSSDPPTLDQSKKRSNFLSSALDTDELSFAPPSSAWRLGVFTLPFGQNFFIRARGYYVNGSRYGTESMVEHIQAFYKMIPTAASVPVSGRVMAGTRAVSGATVASTDMYGNTVSTRTNSFGYYRFENMTIGQTYFFEVRAKAHSFAPQSITLMDGITDLIFQAEE